ncbi:MAG: FadR/GntR family transcriptional regulator [Porticoccaceae bacterium]
MGRNHGDNKKRLYRQVVDGVVALIDSGEYPVGSRLPAEREMSERFGVSRPTIREAVIALEAMGRVAVGKGSGVHVVEWRGVKGVESTVSPFELLETRVLVEGESAALAASMITPDQLEALAEALKEMEQENLTGKTDSNMADRKFHSIIAEATNNRVLTTMIENLWETQDGLRHIKMAHQAVCTSEPGVRLKEHQAIYEALASGDSQAARFAMRKHFARGIDALHRSTEEEAVEAVRRKLTETRERFSMNRLNETVSAK